MLLRVLDIPRHGPVGNQVLNQTPHHSYPQEILEGACFSPPQADAAKGPLSSEDNYGGLDSASSSPFSLAYLQIVWNSVKYWEIV